MKNNAMQFIDLAAQQIRIKDKLDARIQAVMAHGKYIMGPEVRELEIALASYCGAKHCISCANGTDALYLALLALSVGEGDAVFVPSFTFASTIEVIPRTGATPFLVDIDIETFNMSPKSLKRCVDAAVAEGLRPFVVIPVDLFGLPANYAEIGEIAKNHGMKVIGDSAQGFGSSIGGQMSGTFADITTTSFFPAKPLGCYGDGGALFTDDDQLTMVLESLRVHGKGSEKYDNVRVGINSRLDTLQAAILLEKLLVYPDEIEVRKFAANRYSDSLSGKFSVPTVPNDYSSVWAQYTLRAESEQERSRISQLATRAGVPTMVYYPKPLHEQIAYKHCLQDPEGLNASKQAAQTAFSLPMHGYLSNQDIDLVVSALAN